MNVNVNLMVENVQIKKGIIINVDASVKIKEESCVQRRLFLESSCI